MYDRVKLHGKTALVTGGEGRLGPIWARALEDAGADVLTVDQDDYDLRHPDQVEALAIDYANVDILVNNAGVDSRPDGCDGGWAQAMVDVNLLATHCLCERVGGQMAARGHGAIINIASLYGLVAPDMRYYDHREDKWVKDAVYGATKASIVSLTQYWAARLGPKGVRVNALAPGGVVVGTDGLTAQDPAFAAKYTARIPMGRMCRADDLGGPLVFLASDMASFVNGITIPIDGGFLCW